MKIRSVQGLQGRTILDYYFAAKNAAQDTVNNYPHKQLIGMKTEELTEYIYQQYALSPLEIDETRQIEWDKVVSKEQRKDIFGRDILRDITYVKIIFPIKPGLKLSDSLQYQANTFQITVLEFDLDETNFTVSVEVNPEYENVEQAIQKYLQIFADRTANINTENRALRATIQASIEQKKKRIMEDDTALDALMQKVSIPLKKRGEPTDYQVPLQVRTDIRRLSHPQSTPPKDLKLTQEQLDSIIKVIDVDGRNFENAPGTYVKLDEPDLRNIILAHLNHYFPDDATGETFVNKGKTDIRLKVFEGEILIAECKYWGSEDEYSKAIDQLFRYLTWRYNYGLIIIFSKNAGFTAVLNKIKAATQKHPSYHGSFTELGPTHFRSVHTFPDDPQKKVELHILAYNLYYNKEKFPS